MKDSPILQDNKKKDSLREKASHGSVSFPLACYVWGTPPPNPFREFSFPIISEEPKTYKSPFSSYEVKLHWHDEMEIICLERGNFLLNINMNERKMNAPAFLFIPPGVIHSIMLEPEQIENAIVFDRSMLRFSYTDGVEYHVIGPLLSDRLTFPECLTPIDPAWKECYFLYHKLLSIAENTDLPSQLRIKAYLYEMLAVLYEYGCLKETISLPRQDTERLMSFKKILSHIHENYGRRISVQELSSIAGMNPQYFCRYFKKLTGKTIIHYINEYRMAQAAAMLRETSMQIIDIALTCGCENTSYFTRCFHKYYHLSPSAYRKSYR